MNGNQNRINDQNNEEINLGRLIRFFIFKYIFRTFHIISIVFVFGHLSYTVFFGPREQSSSLQAVNITFSIILILSGLFNMITMILEKAYKKDSLPYKLWKYSLMVKVFLSLFLTPLMNAIVKSAVDDPKNETSDKARFSLALVMFLYSPFLRYYREYFMKPLPDGR